MMTEKAVQKVCKDKKRDKIKCWEFFKCNKTECPAYKSSNLKCWLFSESYCRSETQGKLLKKMEMCLGCEVLKANIDVSAMRKTIDIADKQIKELRYLVDNGDRANKNLEEKFIENEKLSSLGRLTATVIHDIKNPVLVIAGFAEKLKKVIPPETREKELLDLICLEAKRLEEILADILVFSNKPFYLREKMDIHEIIDESLDIYESILKVRSISVNKFFGNVTQIFIDKRQVKYAINNLISNAIYAMPDGGTLTISTIENSLNEKNYVAVEITDTGVGISGDNLSLIFEPFFTTKETKRGTGLGLSITKIIVEGHGGFINIDSSVGKGSAFSLYFPYRAR